MTYRDRLLAGETPHLDNIRLWPRHLYCPLCGGISAIIDTGATGVKYRCSLCTVEYRLPAAQARKRKVAKAIARVVKRLADF